MTKHILALILALVATAAWGAENDADFSRAVFIRDASTLTHGGAVHYWTNADDAYLGWTDDANPDDACRFELIPAGTDADGNARYKVRHIASGLYVEGLRYITNEAGDESDVRSPLVSDVDKAHALTFRLQDNGHYYICDTTLDRANGYNGENGKYNYAMCGNYGNVGGYWFDYTFENYGYVLFACDWEVVPAPKADDLDVAPIPDGQEVYVALIPGWSSHGQYLWTSDGVTAGITQLDTNAPADNDFAAAAFVMVPTDDPQQFKFFHIQSRRYLYGLNYIADSPTSDPNDIYDGDPWDNRCVMTSDEARAHALILDVDYTYTTRSGKVYDFRQRGWTAIKDPVVEHPGDGTHYYGGDYGYCVYMGYRSTNYTLGGFGSVLCGRDADYYSADPWIIRTPAQLAAHLGLKSIDSQIPTGIGTVLAPTAADGTAPLDAARYDLQGRRVSSPRGVTIHHGRKTVQ